MQTSAPKQITLLVSLALVVLGLLVPRGIIANATLGEYALWLMVGGYALLFLGCVVRDL